MKRRTNILNMGKYLSLILFGFSYSLLGQTILTGNIGKDFTITKPGVYQVQGTVTGNITISPTSEGNITIEGIGVNPTLQGIPWGDGAARSNSHFSGAALGASTLTWRNLTIKGDGQNAMESEDSDVSLKIYENLHVINYSRTENGQTYSDVGGINGGGNSIIRNSYIEAGDDASKLTEKNSRIYNSRIRLTKNGAAIQFGWNDRFGDPNHIADTLEIRGQLEPNIKDQSNESDNPGRCIIGGIVQMNGENIRLTNLDIDVTKYKHLIKIVAQDGATNDPVLKDVLIQGKITDASIMNTQQAGTQMMKCVALTAKDGAKIRNMVIDLGDKIADTQYHYISGDVDVKFIKKDKSVVEYIGGKLQSATEIKKENNEILSGFHLDQNYPNPFNPATTIKFQIRTESNVVLKVNDLLGREVLTLISGVKEAGYYSVLFDGANLASGIYYAQLLINPADGGRPITFTKKMVLAK